MKSPITGKEMQLKKERAILPFRKDEFSIVYHFYLCEDTGEQFTNDDLDHINQIQVHNQYREKYGIPFPEEILSIRQKYNVSASKISEILGFGANTYRSYENGEVPSVANGRLILSIKQPEEFIRQVKASEHILTKKETEKYIETAEEIEKQEKDQIWEKLFESHIFQFEIPNEFSGYRKPDFNKIGQVISFFDGKVELYKTKLNKLLFYSDFALYQKTGYSITGITYRAIPYGPVPAEYEKLYMKLKDDQRIEITEVLFENGNYGEVIISKQNLDYDTFSKLELQILNKILERFRGMNTKEVIDISHEEDAWKENKDDRKIISYQKYAYDLKAFPLIN